MQHGKALLSSIGLMTLLSQGCKPLADVNLTAYVIGTNDIKEITSENKGSISKAHLAAVVLIATNIDATARKFCSGTLIFPAQSDEAPRILTNHHCFAAVEPNTQAISRNLLAGHCNTTKVYFGFFKGETDLIEVGECEEGSFRSDFEGDIAVFKLRAKPSDSFIPARLWSRPEIPMNRKARVVHFPTVDNKAETVFVPSAGISLPLAQVTDENCVTQGSFPEKEWGVDKSLAMGVKHSCDLKKGSSGSALWDVETDVLLGVNWGGISLKYNDPERTEVYNVATRAEYVQSFLEGKSQEVKDSLKAKQVAAADYNSAESKSEAKKHGLCGVVAPSQSATSSLIWLALPPLFALRRRPQKRHLRT